MILLFRRRRTNQENRAKTAGKPAPPVQPSAEISWADQDGFKADRKKKTRHILFFFFFLKEERFVNIQIKSAPGLKSIYTN